MILYKKDKNKKQRFLEIWADGPAVCSKSGLVGGKSVLSAIICSPKNIGKSNETTATQQAELEAAALIAKKLKKGYTTSIEDTSDVLLPMKVNVYQDFVKHVKPDAYCSFKLNGVNGEFRLLKDDKLILLSRGGEEYPMLKHLESLVIEYLKRINQTSINVELYRHGWHLQDITAAVKKFKDDTHEYPSSQISAHIFDIPSYNETYETRRALLDAIPTNSNMLQVIPAYQFVDIEEFHTKAVSQGYEGIVINNPKGLYVYNTRSLDAFKYKKVKDGEYIITNYTLDREGNPTLICSTSTNEFKVRPKGTKEKRKEILDNISSYIGSWYKIEYETLSKDGIPLKPIGIGLRKCNSTGTPLE